MKKTLLTLSLACIMALANNCAGGPTMHENTQPRVHENVEWQNVNAFHLSDSLKDLPRVLLVGNSITSIYQEYVREILDGKVNVSYWATSYCVTSPNYLKYLELQLEETHFDVVHFNNGLHTAGGVVDNWSKCLENALRLIRAKQPDAKIIWASSTPTKDSLLNLRIDSLNQAARKVIAKVGDIRENDLYSLFNPLDRDTYWVDTHHHNITLRKWAAARVAEDVLFALHDETAAIQHQIDSTSMAGGGVVEIPAGEHYISTLCLKSNITLHLLKDAQLIGSRNTRDYGNLLYNSAQSNVSEVDDYAMIFANEVQHVAIIGEEGSMINGNNCPNPNGGEGYRGPLGISLANSSDITLRGYTICHTGDYAHWVRKCQGVNMKHVTTFGGHDGIHMRLDEHVTVDSCSFNVGDDAIAGFANLDVTVSNCILRSSCSPVRFGGTDVLITDCVADSSDYPHRWTVSQETKLKGLLAAPTEGRRNMGCFFQYFTDAYFDFPRAQDNMVFRNITVRNPELFACCLTGKGVIWHAGPGIAHIRFENVHVENARQGGVIAMAPEQPLNLVMENCSFSFRTPQPYGIVFWNTNLECPGLQTKNLNGEFAKVAANKDEVPIPDTFPSWTKDDHKARKMLGME